MKVKIKIYGLNGKMGSFIANHLQTNYEISEDGDIVVDFTHADCSFNNIKESLKAKKKVISGTTNIPLEQINQLKKISIEEESSFIWVPNFSIGATITSDLLIGLSDFFDKVSILETHNQAKADIPSGTSKEYGQILKCDNIISYRTETKKAIHEIILENQGEKLSIIHQIDNKEAFLKGFDLALNRLIVDDYILLVGLSDFMDLLKNV